MYVQPSLILYPIDPPFNFLTISFIALVTLYKRLHDLCTHMRRLAWKVCLLLCILGWCCFTVCHDHQQRHEIRAWPTFSSTRRILWPGIVTPFLGSFAEFFNLDTYMGGKCWYFLHKATVLVATYCIRFRFEEFDLPL